MPTFNLHFYKHISIQMYTFLSALHEQVSQIFIESSVLWTMGILMYMYYYLDKCRLECQYYADPMYEQIEQCEQLCLPS